VDRKGRRKTRTIPWYVYRRSEAVEDDLLIFDTGNYVQLNS
jgi:hypothetical protein